MTPTAAFSARTLSCFFAISAVMAVSLLPAGSALASGPECPDTVGSCRLIAHWGERHARAFPDAWNFGSESFSVACWFQSKPQDPGGCLVRKGIGDGAPGFHLETDEDGRIEAGVGAADPGEALRFRTERSVTDGSWHHVAVIVDRRNAQAAVYVDGRICELEQAAGSAGELDDEGLFLTFPGLKSLSGECPETPVVLAAPGGDDASPRCVEDVRIYLGALPAPSIKSLFHEPEALARNGERSETRQALSKSEVGARKPEVETHAEARRCSEGN